MKYTIKASLLLLSVITFLFTSCSKSAEKIITKGTWTVSLYQESGKDETTDFNNYVFDFQSGGTLSVTVPTGSTVNGTWSYDDASTKYVLHISGTDKLDKINGSWFIVSKSSSLIELKDDNSSNNEVLNFKKK